MQSLRLSDSQRAKENVPICESINGGRLHKDRSMTEAAFLMPYDRLTSKGWGGVTLQRLLAPQWPLR